LTRSLVSASAISAAAAILAGCTVEEPPPPLFEGDLIALGGQSVVGSMLHIKLTSTDDDPTTAERYFIYSVGCLDSGFLDETDGKFWSGLSPEKNGELGEHLRRMPLEAKCPPEDAARYIDLMQLMRGGVSLQLDSDGRFATFTNPSGGSARFEVYLGNIVD
jgi:hypothetical protein